MDMKSVCLCVLVFSLRFVCGQYLTSPCPGVFDFEDDGHHVYGVITLRPVAPVSSLILRMNFTITSQRIINNTYEGRIDAVNSKTLLQRYNQGQPVSYLVHFPVTSWLPKLTALTVNGDIICSGRGDQPRPNMYITTLSLQHTTLPERGTGEAPVYDNFQLPPQTRPQPGQQEPIRQAAVNHIHIGEDDATAQIYTLNKNKPIWTTGNSPNVGTMVSAGPDETIECGTVSGGNNRIPLIYNGNAYDRGELPWLVAIYKSEQGSLRFACGGTLVSDRHIVSAAHCMLRRGTLTSIQDIVIKIGVHNLNDWSDEITITRTLQAANIHEAYNPSTLQNDILMFTLDKRVKFNHYIRPACLWSGNTDLSVIVGTKGVVAGWGDQGVGGVGRQGEPHKVDVPIVSTNDCRASKALFHELTYDNTLCAGDRQGSGPCVGDSGGGMYLLQDGKWRVRGVVSVSLRAENGDFTCNLHEYVVFTDVAQFLPWIKNILAQN